MLKLNTQNLGTNEWISLESKALNSYKELTEQTGKGNEFLGWLRQPEDYDRAEYARIKAAASKIQNDSEVLVVIGIGGSYLGAKAVINALTPYFKKTPLEIVFAGHTLSSTYAVELLDYLKTKSFSINVISKSGTTTEPAVLFRMLKELLFDKYGPSATSRIYATTDIAKGALITQAKEMGYSTFVVPDNIGGRYSVFTAVGLLPIACAGIDIDQLMLGANTAMKDCYNTNFKANHALQYAAIRNHMYKSKKIEALITFEPKISFISEWWKQLFGESEGKDGRGLFPASLTYSTDLHSLGQYIQEGERIMFETVIDVVRPQKDIVLTTADDDLDGMNYLATKTLDEVNHKAMEGTILAHVDGQVPNLVIELSQLDAKHVGYLLYFFMFSCGVACYMLGVNPFDQPGVESYKKNMFALLGKKGYEELAGKLKERLKK